MEIVKYLINFKGWHPVLKNFPKHIKHCGHFPNIIITYFFFFLFYCSDPTAAISAKSAKLCAGTLPFPSALRCITTIAYTCAFWVWLPLPLPWAPPYEPPRSRFGSHQRALVPLPLGTSLSTKASMWRFWKWQFLLWWGGEHHLLHKIWLCPKCLPGCLLPVSSVPRI